MPTWTPPTTLVANTPENVNDLNAIFTSLQTVLNGGLDETNVPNLAAAFTTYKGSLARGAFSAGGVAANTYLFPPTGVNSLAAAAGAIAVNAFYIDPADWAANARVAKMRLRAVGVTNAVAPAVTFTFGLYPVASTGGASGANPSITIGTVVAGSTAAITTPAATSTTPATSTDFNAPAAGLYVLGVVVSATMAAGSITHFTYDLQYRQV